MEARVRPAYAELEKAEGEAAAGRACPRRAPAAAACALAGAAALALAAGCWERREAAAAGALRGELLILEESPDTTVPPRVEEEVRTCSRRTFQKPPKPRRATELNGIRLDDVCFDKPPYHVFIIGDWGGVKTDGQLKAVRHLSHRWNASERYKYVWPTDAACQWRVRDQMAARAAWAKPSYILNVGDNFYWEGVEDYCGAWDISETYSNGGSVEHKHHPVDQFREIFEEVYVGPGLDGVPWLGVLGNHDWGGWRMDLAWDQAVGYTWSRARHSTRRWLTPALYWQVTVRYHDFSVDYYFLDSNVFDALPYGEQPKHNICGPHNYVKGNCTSAGGPPERGKACKKWFEDLWYEQKVWLDGVVPKSTAEWRVVVTHFPPYWGKYDWQWLAPRHEIDVIISGHRHSQSMHGPTDEVNRIWAENATEMNDFLDPTAWVVSGGGGGITSEHLPNPDGWDDQYGFVHMTLTKKTLKFEMISHGGQLRHTMVLDHHYSHGGRNEVVKVTA